MAPKVIEPSRHGSGCAEEAFPLETCKGMERMIMPWYKHYLGQHCISSLDDVEEKLKTGGSVLDFSAAVQAWRRSP